MITAEKAREMSKKWAELHKSNEVNLIKAEIERSIYNSVLVGQNTSVYEHVSSSALSVNEVRIQTNIIVNHFQSLGYRIAVAGVGVRLKSFHISWEDLSL